jgi:hypothetical protein
VGRQHLPHRILPEIRPACNIADSRSVVHTRQPFVVEDFENTTRKIKNSVSLRSRERPKQRKLVDFHGRLRARLYNGCVISVTAGLSCELDYLCHISTSVVNSSAIFLADRDMASTSCVDEILVMEEHLFVRVIGIQELLVDTLQKARKLSHC